MEPRLIRIALMPSVVSKSTDCPIKNRRLTCMALNNHGQDKLRASSQPSVWHASTKLRSRGKNRKVRHTTGVRHQTRIGITALRVQRKYKNSIVQSKYALTYTNKILPKIPSRCYAVRRAVPQSVPVPSPLAIPRC